MYATTGQLALAVLAEQAAALQEQAPGVRAGDAHAIHQMRVATRRLRAALRLFSDLLPEQATHLNDELKWIAAKLGAARDLDVQLQRLHASATELGIDETVEAYAAWLGQEREGAQTELLEAIQTPRFDRLVEALNTVGDWPRMNDLPLLDDAPSRLKAAYKRLNKRAKRLATDSPAPNFHEVRVRAKRVRYAAEFFERVPGWSPRAQRVVSSLTDIQDILGALQDGVVGRERIEAALAVNGHTWDVDVALTLGRIVEHDHVHGGSLRLDFFKAYEWFRDRAWKRFESKFAMS